MAKRTIPLRHVLSNINLVDYTKLVGWPLMYSIEPAPSDSRAVMLKAMLDHSSPPFNAKSPLGDKRTLGIQY